jgi:putative transmembrane protein PGPGW
MIDADHGRDSYAGCSQFISECSGANHSLNASNSMMMKRVAFNAAGWGLVILGGAGLLLPVLPGVMLLILGLSFLSLEYKWARRLMGPMLRRFPAAEKKLEIFLARHAKPVSADLSA